MATIIIKRYITTTTIIDLVTTLLIEGVGKRNLLRKRYGFQATGYTVGRIILEGITTSALR
tara:strand:- start:197 stop:379 length:183 start_codon:yes stop_codon:yes gene_type:complete